MDRQYDVFISYNSIDQALECRVGRLFCPPFSGIRYLTFIGKWFANTASSIKNHFQNFILLASELWAQPSRYRHLILLTVRRTVTG
jgi:hypothetical protein